MPVKVSETWDYGHSDEQSAKLADFFQNLDYGKLLDTEFSPVGGPTRVFVDEDAAQEYVDFIKSFDPPPVEVIVK
jgi:hypothetical protein